MLKKAWTAKIEKAIETLESKYGSMLFDAWDDEEKSLKDTIKELLIKEDFGVTDNELEEITDYITFSFM